MKKAKKQNKDGLSSFFNTCQPGQFGQALSPLPLKNANTYYGNGATLAHSNYSLDGLARNIIDLPIRRALSKWLELDDSLAIEFKRLKVRDLLYKAASFARLYGGAIVVAYCDDGADSMEQPLGDSLNQVYQFKTYDRFEVQIPLNGWDIDSLSPNYGNPLFYEVTPVTPYVTGRIMTRIHHTRCFQLNGLMATNQEANTLLGWGVSALAPVADALANYSYSMSAFPSIIKDFVQVVIKLKELAATAALGAEGEAAVKARLNVINQGRSVLNAIMIDGEDDYNKSASSVAGLGDMIDRMMMQVAATTGFPVSLLFGRSAQGMNATGQGDENIFNEFVAAYQETDLAPLIDWVVGLVGKQATWIEGEDGLKWAWPDLAPIDEKDRADIKLKNAQTDNIYIQAGAVHAKWLYQQRHQEVYGFDVNADPEAYEEWASENEVGEQVHEDPEEA